MVTEGDLRRRSNPPQRGDRGALPRIRSNRDKRVVPFWGGFSFPTASLASGAVFVGVSGIKQNDVRFNARVEASGCGRGCTSEGEWDTREEQYLAA